jgi:adenylate kinase family enzyme
MKAHDTPHASGTPSAAPRAPHHVHILGGSGSGTSTLGRHLANQLSATWVDTDSVYWMPSDPPFTVKRPIPERLALLETRLPTASDWVLSGSMISWGTPLIAHLTDVVLLSLDPDTRMARLRAREVERYGAARIAPGGDLYEAHCEFMAWAARYDWPDQTIRSRDAHDAWLAALPPHIRIHRLDSAAPVDVLVAAVSAGLREAERAAPPRAP